MTFILSFKQMEESDCFIFSSLMNFFRFWRLICLLFFSLVFLYFAKGIKAQVVINEFSPASSPEWVELYNTSDNEVSLDGFVIYFHSTTDTVQKKVFCSNHKISSKSFFLIETSGFLNNDGDTIMLKQVDDTVDSISYGTGRALPKIDPSKSGKRDPDGSSNWIVSDTPSRNGEVLSFDCPTPTFSPTPTPNPTSPPTQSQTSKPTATLKINDARDQNDNVLTGSLKIFIDGSYTGNYTPETYTFCDDCKCGNNNVPCGFGSHTIKVEKTGYLDWTKTLEISANNNYEETPILNLQTPLPTQTPKPSTTPKTSPTPQAENIIQASESALTQNLSPKPMVLGLESARMEEEKESSNSDTYFNIAAVFFIIAGLSFLSAASYAYFRSKKKGKKESETESVESEKIS